MDPAKQLILAFEWKWHPPTFSKIMWPLQAVLGRFSRDSLNSAVLFCSQKFCCCCYCCRTQEWVGWESKKLEEIVARTFTDFYSFISFWSCVQEPPLWPGAHFRSHTVKISQCALRREAGKNQWWIETTSPSTTLCQENWVDSPWSAAMEGEMAGPASCTKASTEQAAGSLYCLDGCGSLPESSALWVLWSCL